MVIKIRFNSMLTAGDPEKRPVLIIGQLRHLHMLKFSDISCKLEPRVTEEKFYNAIRDLHPPSIDKCSLYMDAASVAAVPLECSRYNAPSRAFAITRLVKYKMLHVHDQSFVIVCERSDIFASACAVVRAFPLHSQKTRRCATSNSPTNFDGYAGDDNITINLEFVVIEKDGRVAKLAMKPADIACLEETARGIRLAARIVDTPSNGMNVGHFVKEAQRFASELSITSKIICGEELQELGFGGIYGVGKGATVPPALVVLSHEPMGAQQTIALVGNGIVYDRGVRSVNHADTMPAHLKRDYGGAAVILAAFYVAVKSGFKENLHAVLCLAENLVGPNATRPYDIHRLYSGRTVEINNTDENGRLVLADGVSYAHKDLKADIILDMSTTDGQCIITSKYHGALLTNNEEWETKSLEAGRKSGDLLAPIPYCPELHFSEFESEIADMKNSVSNRNNAQSSCAGLFIAANLGFDYPGVYIHVDMAMPVRCDERVTGYGVALLLALFGNYTNSALLKSIAPKPSLKRVYQD